MSSFPLYMSIQVVSFEFIEYRANTKRNYSIFSVQNPEENVLASEAIETEEIED